VKKMYDFNRNFYNFTIEIAEALNNPS